MSTAPQTAPPTGLCRILSLDGGGAKGFYTLGVLAQVEAMFKAFAKALRFAVTRDKQMRRVLPSTKGLL